MKKILIGLFLMMFTAFAYSQSVTGVVSDDSGAPLPGVSVIVKGTTIGTATDIDGKFTLTPNNMNSDVLQFSFIGFDMQEIAINGQSVINATMVTSELFLEEVVAVGYGTVKKRDLTGSVGSVDSDMITERGSTSPMEALQGQVAGVQISTNTGRVGGGFDITIRGVNTLSDTNQPLYVVDGVPTDNIDFLNPQDIARIDILKDASSTAIYGSRGTNGVVLVTTKQADDVQGSYSIAYSGYYGIKDIARLPKMMDGPTWWQYRQDARIAGWSGDDLMTLTQQQVLDAAGSNPWLDQRIADGIFTDWYDEVLHNGEQQNHYISISGRSKNNMSYVVGVGYQGETGLIDKESVDKYSIKANIFHEINDQWTVGTNLNFALIDAENGNNQAMQDAFRLPPIAVPREVDGPNVGQLVEQPGKYFDPITGEDRVGMTSTYNPLLTIANSEITKGATMCWVMLSCNLSLSRTSQ